MRRIFIPSLALTLVPFVTASAQESLCNPCVDPPVIRRYDIDSLRPTWPVPVIPTRAVPVTAEQMRGLGVTSIAQMINQLPSNAAASPYGRPVSLGSADAFPAGFAAVFAAAASHLQSLEYVPAEFNARLVMCPEGRCILVIYPAELGDAGAMIVGECPVGYCARLIYSLSEERVVEIRD